MQNRITLDQLRILVAIDEERSFSAAGRKLRRAQSAISHAIHAFEEAQQLTLFDRSAHLPRLTDAGRILVAQARQVLRHTDLFERTAGAIAAGIEPELTLAIDPFVPAGPIITSLAGLRAEFPNLVVNLYTEVLWGSERRIRARSATLAVCCAQPAAAQDLQAYPVMAMELTPVVAPSHALAHEIRPLTRDILAEHVQLVLTDPHDQSGSTYSVVSPRVWRFADLGKRLEFMLAGFGWGTMPAHLVTDHIQSGTLVRLSIDDPAILPGTLPLHIVHHRDHLLGRAATWLLANLQSQDWPRRN